MYKKCLIRRFAIRKLFEGVKVIDFSNNIAGPLISAMMADFGAEVIKVEKPVVGDDSRCFTPFVEGISFTFMWLNRGKKSIVLDIKNPEGKKIFKLFVEKADVLVESFRPGVMERLGLNYEELKKINPKLIMCSASAFGQTGPYRQLAGYDLIAQAVSGVMDITGYPDGPPTKIGPSLADYCCSFNAFGAIASALYYREKTGIGQHIDVSLAECLLALNDYIEMVFLDPKITRNGNHHSMIAPYGVFNGKNGSIAIGAINENLWAKLCKLIGKEEYIDHPDYNNTGKRVKVLDSVIEMIETWLKTFNSMDEAEKILKENGIPCAKISKIQDLMTDPHFLARGMITDFKIPQLSVGSVKARGIHIKFSETPGEMGVGPELGEHTNEILKDNLGLDDKEINELKTKGAFGTK